jgi:DNA repair protein RecN (Recombination protein N)
MLTSLSIRDFVIVDTLELEFDAGFSVFSGETGAGKSILVDALAVLLGGRADALMVRAGANRAELSALCELTNQASAWLVEHDIELEENRALLRRNIDAQGKSRAWINGAVVTVAQLREFGESLIDIYGQHAHQALLKRTAQRQLLDQQAGLTEAVRQLAERMAAWRAAGEKLEQARGDQSMRAAEQQRLAWQLEELERLDARPGEWQEIQQEQQRLAHAASLIEAAQAGVDELQEADGALLSRLAPHISRLSQLSTHDVRLVAVLEVLEPARIQLQEAARALRQYLDHLELDPAGLKRVEARLDAIHSTARKLRIAPEQLVEQREQLSAELSRLDAASDLEALERLEEKAKGAYFELARTVRSRREITARELGAAVTQAMQSLSMNGGRFQIALENCEPSSSGTEQVEFLVAAHSGVEPRALARVASGGELARISLAISVIASTSQATPTLIFDEVDAGIGGAVAEVVGRLLRQLGQQRQVLCVTHLPQVAARAEHHFNVSKAERDSQTLSQVTLLSKSARIDELARMLGGVDITSTTRKHAREMLSLSAEP